MNIKNVEKGNVTTQKSLVLKSRKIMYFHSDCCIPANEKLLFILANVYIPGESHCAGKFHDMFVSQHNKYNLKCTCDYKEICQVISKHVHSK